MDNINIDRTDAAVNTKAPFQYGCRLAIGSFSLPANAFLSIKVYLDAGYLAPARISRISVVDSVVHLLFVDAESRSIGTWSADSRVSDLSYISGFIYDSMSVLRGHVVCSADTPGILRAMVNYCGGSFDTLPGDFILLPQCNTYLYKGKLKSFNVNGTWSTADTTIHAGENVELKIIDNNDGYTHPKDIRYSIIGPSDGLPNMSNLGAHKMLVGEMGIDTIIVRQQNGSSMNTLAIFNDVAGKNLILKSGISSNLRVVVNDDGINIKGVLDG